MRTYLKYLSRNKLYTFVTIIGFALSLMFVFVLGFYVRHERSADRFHSHYKQIYQLNFASKKFDWANSPITSYPAGTLIKERIPVVEDVCRISDYNNKEYVFTGNDPEQGLLTSHISVQSNFFSFFDGFKLKEGNPKDVLIEKGSAVISTTLASKLFGSESPIGKEIFFYDFMKEKNTYRITGIMKPMSENSHITPVELLLYQEPAEGDVNHGNYITYIKAKSGEDLVKKEDLIHKAIDGKDVVFFFDKEAITKVWPLEKCYLSPFSKSDMSFLHMVKKGNIDRIRMISAVTLLILVIAIISYINLTLAQAGSRGREVALKKLLGSSRSAIVFQLWKESLLVILLSTLVALMTMFLMEPVFDRLFDTHLYLSQNITLSLILILIGLMLVLSVICAVLPAWFISRFRPVDIVSGKFRRLVKSRFSQVMVVSQYVITMVLIGCTLIMGWQIRFMTNSDLGYNYKNMLTVSVFGMETKTINTIKEEFEKIPGITGVGLTRGTPVNGGNNNSSNYKGKPTPMQIFQMDSVALRLMNLKMKPNGLQAGDPDRAFYLSRAAYNDFDMANLPDNVIHWGQAGDFYYCGDAPDLRFGGFKGVQSSYLFSSFPSSPKYLWSILVGYDSHTDYVVLTEKLRSTYSRITGIPYTEIKRTEDTIAEHSREERSIGGFLLLFSILALISTVMSVFAMSALRIRHKQKEIAIRKVIGAREVQILKIISRQSLWNLLAAFVVSCPITYFIMQRWLQGYTYHTAMPWWAFPAALLIVSSVAFISMLSMSLKAAVSNPVDYLKNE